MGVFLMLLSATARKIITKLALYLVIVEIYGSRFIVISGTEIAFSAFLGKNLMSAVEFLYTIQYCLVVTKV